MYCILLPLLLFIILYNTPTISITSIAFIYSFHYFTFHNFIHSINLLVHSLYPINYLPITLHHLFNYFTNYIPMTKSIAELANCEREINELDDDSAHIFLENEVDYVLPTSNFQFINDYVTFNSEIRVSYKA